MTIQDCPISNVRWIEVQQLKANDYNPNVVFSDEMKLLRFSILKNGWIQPILVTKDLVIIDGFHRATLAKKYADVTCRGLVPCCVMDISEPERMLLTIRINRAKGKHIAIKMHDIVLQLVNDYQYTPAQIAEGIGARKEEVELLLKQGVFEAKNITEETQYSKAWYPVPNGHA